MAILVCRVMQERIQIFVKGVKMELRFLGVGEIANLQCVWNTKHKPSREVWGHISLKLKSKLWDWTWNFLQHKIAMLRTGSGQSVVREISLAVHAWVANPEWVQEPPLTPAPGVMTSFKFYFSLLNSKHSTT